MADIARYPFTRHLRSSATTHVLHLAKGKVVHTGIGQSFWFRPLNAVLAEIPVDDRELPLLFHARTADYQTVGIQATLTYRFTDPTLAATRIDFSIDQATGRWLATPLEQIAGMLTEAAQQHVLDLMAHTDLTDALTSGATAGRDAIAAGLRDDRRLADIGIDVVSVRVVAVRPEPDVEKALQTPARERVQQEADKATYERRALAVERERAISENELQSQIELARREEQLVAQRGANARRQAQESAAAGGIETTATADRDERLAQAKANGTRAMGEAQAAAEAASLAAYRDLPQEVLLGLALKELATNLPRIQSLVLTPDLLAPLLARLGTPVTAATHQR